MTHLYIELNTGLTEEVSSSIISKLYELAISGDLDNTSDLKGRLHSTSGYRSEIEYLNANYQDLYISADDYAIPFEDPNMLPYLLNLGIGSNGMITESQAAAATSVANTANTTITKFNELKYFTNVTGPKGGFDANSDGNIRFYGWTALEEIDISNLLSISHSNINYYDSFGGCTSLKKVTASDNLTKLGNSAFYNCSNLETFTGLSGTIEVYDYAFCYCSKLPQSFFSPLSFAIKKINTTSAGENFRGCTLLSSINITNDTVVIPLKCFYDCTSLTSIVIPSTVSKIENNAFYNCSSLQTVDISTNNLELELAAFDKCSNLTTITSQNSPLIVANSYAFYRCSNLLSTTSIQIRPKLSNSVAIFMDCPSLLEVTLQNDDIYLPNSTFKNCSNLTTINNIQYVTGLDEQVFKGCSSLTHLDLSGLNSAQYTSEFKLNVFDGCSNLTTLGTDTFTNITKISFCSFYNCYNLTGLLNFPNVTEIVYDNYGCNFINCRKLTKLSFDKVEDYLGGSDSGTRETRGLASGCSLLKIMDFGTQVKCILANNFVNCSALQAVVINTNDVPYNSITNDTYGRIDKTLEQMFGNYSVNIYVPDAAVSTYQQTLPYSNFLSHIKPISQFNESSILGQ